MPILLDELEGLADAFRLDRARRKMTPRAAEARAELAKAAQALRAAADAVSELDRHELAMTGATVAEVTELHAILEAWPARIGAGRPHIASRSTTVSRPFWNESSLPTPEMVDELIRQRQAKPVEHRLAEERDRAAEEGRPTWSTPGGPGQWRHR